MHTRLAVIPIPKFPGGWIMRVRSGDKKIEANVRGYPKQQSEVG